MIRCCKSQQATQAKRPEGKPKRARKVFHQKWAFSPTCSQIWRNPLGWGGGGIKHVKLPNSLIYKTWPSVYTEAILPIWLFMRRWTLPLLSSVINDRSGNPDIFCPPPWPRSQKMHIWPQFVPRIGRSSGLGVRMRLINQGAVKNHLSQFRVWSVWPHWAVWCRLAMVW